MFESMAMTPALLTVLGGAFDYASKTGVGQAMVQSAARKKAGADFAAAQLEQNAGQQEAASQRAAQDVSLQNQIGQSRLIALAAAQGGATTDPTVMLLRSRMAAEGAYRASQALYQGSEAARGMRAQAAAQRYQGEMGVEDAASANRAAQISGLASLVKTGSSFYEKYSPSDTVSTARTWDPEEDFR